MHAARAQILNFPTPSATAGVGGVDIYGPEQKLLEQVCGDIITASSTYSSNLEKLSEEILQILLGFSRDAAPRQAKFDPLDVLLPSEAAEKLRISDKTLKLMMDDGEISFFYCRTRRRFTRQDIEKYIRNEKDKVCLFTNPKALHTTNLTSKSGGSGFTAARRKRQSEKLKS